MKPPPFRWWHRVAITLGVRPSRFRAFRAYAGGRWARTADGWQRVERCPGAAYVDLLADYRASFAAALDSDDPLKLLAVVTADLTAPDEVVACLASSGGCKCEVWEGAGGVNPSPAPPPPRTE